MKIECPICLKSAESDLFAVDLGKFDKLISCPRCGKYRITETLSNSNIEKYGKRYYISAVVRNLYEQNPDVYLTDSTIKTLLESVNEPSDPLEKIDLLIKFIYRNTGKPGNIISLDDNKDYPLLFAENPAEFRYYVYKARDLKFIEETTVDGKKGWQLSLDGWKKINELKKDEKMTDQAFVAMWFDPSLDDAWNKGFKKALEETGYRPIRIDLIEHNEKICDRIIAEIRKSSLIVSDVTGHRHNVYFETGLAMGLGIEVIRTCKDTSIPDLKNIFDTRQYSHIVWTDPEDLREKLVNRIEATRTRKLNQKSI